MGHQPHTLGTMSKAITMSTTKSAPKPSASPTEKVLEAKWGKTLIAAGFTALPDVIFQYQKALKLKPLDVLVLLHLASYWWKPNENPWPAKGTIADAIDVDPRTVQRSIAKMEALGYVQRIERKAKAGDNLTNQYSLTDEAVRVQYYDDSSMREPRIFPNTAFWWYCAIIDQKNE